MCNRPMPYIMFLYNGDIQKLVHDILDCTKNIIFIIRFFLHLGNSDSKSLKYSSHHSFQT